MPILGIIASQNYPRVPGIPTIGTSTLSTKTSVSVTFTAAVGGTAATSFTVLSSPGGFSTVGASSPLIVSGLAQGTSYTFTVRANAAGGSSAYSSASNATVTPAPSNTWSLAQTFNSSGNFSPNNANVFFIAAIAASSGLAGVSGGVGGGQSSAAGGAGGRSGAGVGFKNYSLATNTETFSITVGTTAGVYSNHNAVSLSTVSSSGSSNVAGAVNTGSTAGGAGGTVRNSVGNGNPGSAGGGSPGSVNLSEANITQVTISGSGGGGGGGSLASSGNTNSKTGGIAGAGGSGSGAGGAGGNSSYYLPNDGGAMGPGAGGSSSSGIGGAGGGGGGGGAPQGLQGNVVGGVAGNGGGSQVLVYTR